MYMNVYIYNLYKCAITSNLMFSVFISFTLRRFIRIAICVSAFLFLIPVVISEIIFHIDLFNRILSWEKSYIGIN